MENNNNTQTTTVGIPSDSQTTISNSVTTATGDFSTLAGLPVIGTPPVPRGVPAIARSSIGLDTFFARPRPLSTYNWTTAATVTSYFPWYLFVNNAEVKKKLSLFNNFRGTICIAALLSPQPMYGGLLQMSYQPFLGGALTRANIVTRSNLQCIVLNASDGQGGVIKAPFNWLFPFMTPYNSGVTTTQLQDLGTIVVEPITTLVRADGVAPGTLDVQLYYWMEDVHLDTPTYSAQGSELKKDGIISRPATIVGDVAASLKKFPVIGTVATAVEIGARAVSGIASLFGFSKPGNPDDYGLNLVRFVGRSSVVAGRDTAEKLAVDPKQSCAVGGVSAGTYPEDALAFSRLFARYSYTGTAFTWATTDAAGTYLGRVAVSPGYIASTSYPTTLSWVASQFRFWTGSILFRIRVGASAFQRGRLFIIYVPDNRTDQSGTAADTLVGINHHCILDLSSSTDIAFRVNWGQMSDYATNYVTPGSAFALSNTVTIPGDNGALYFFVDAPLTSPAASSIQFAVYIKPGPDFELQDPNLLNDVRYTMQGDQSFTPSQIGQSAVEADTTCDINPQCPTNGFAARHFGEQIQSLRTLAHRWSPYANVISQEGSLSHTPAYWDLVVSMPLYPSIPGANGVVDGISLAGRVWTWPTIAASMFGGLKGGMRYRLYHNIPNTTSLNITASRGWMVTNNNCSLTATSYAAQNLSATLAARGIISRQANGASLIVCHAPGVIEVEVPYSCAANYVHVNTVNGVGFDMPNFGGYATPCIQFCVSTGLLDVNLIRMGIWVASADDFDVDSFIGPGTVTQVAAPTINMQ